MRQEPCSHTYGGEATRDPPAGRLSAELAVGDPNPTDCLRILMGTDPITSWVVPTEFHRTFYVRLTQLVGLTD